MNEKQVNNSMKEMGSPVVFRLEKNSLISVEVVILLLAFAVGLAATWARSETLAKYQNEKFSERFEALQLEASTSRQALSRIERWLLINELTQKDEWSTSSMADYNNCLFAMLSEYHNELSPSEMPPVKEIQKQNLKSLEN